MVARCYSARTSIQTCDACQHSTPSMNSRRMVSSSESATHVVPQRSAAGILITRPHIPGEQTNCETGIKTDGGCRFRLSSACAAGLNLGERDDDVVRPAARTFKRASAGSTYHAMLRSSAL